MNRGFTLFCFAVALASLGCRTANPVAPSNGSDGGADAGADAGTDAGTDAGADAGTDAGTDAGGGAECEYTSSALGGAGWIGEPTCSATNIMAGDSLTCTVFVTGADEAGANLIDRADNSSGGGGFAAVTSDGAVQITIDTQFAQPGEYSVVFDVVPEGGTGGSNVTFGFGPTNDYIALDFNNGMAGDTTELDGCTIITVTVSGI